VDGQIQQAIETLTIGGIVAYPTDTVYGLGASALDDGAVAKVYEAKGRPRHLALPLLLSCVSQIAAVATDVPEIAWRLAERPNSHYRWLRSPNHRDECQPQRPP